MHPVSLIVLYLQIVNGKYNCPRFYVVTLAAREQGLIYRDIACLAVVAVRLVTLKNHVISTWPNAPTTVKGLVRLTSLTLSWPSGHICPTNKESFKVRWDNSIPLFLRAAIYVEVSLFRWTSQNAFSRETAVYKWYCVQCCYAALHTVSLPLSWAHVIQMMDAVG